MRSCPKCGENGIAEHSVFASVDDLERRGPDGAPSYSRCIRCDALFVREGIDTLTSIDSDLKGRVVRTVPPWKDDSVEAHFQLSWDMMEAYYDGLRSQAQLDPLRALLQELREKGFDRKLRAGQSLHALGLSRAKDHGLREGQSHLYLSPEGDGRVRVQGLLDGTKYRFGPVPCTFGGRIQRAIETLATLPTD